MSTEMPQTKRMRFTLEPDLEVKVEGEVVCVDSRVLMAASEVFTKMLTSGMSEAESGRISLVGKSKDDFETLMLHLDLRGGAKPPKIDEKNVNTLLSLSDEYQIIGLKSRCEEHLMYKSYEEPEKYMQMSIEFSLPKLKEKTAQVIARNIYKHRNCIVKCSKYPEVMKVLIPALRSHFGLTRETSDSEGIGMSCAEALCPLIVKTMEMRQEWPSRLEREYYFERARKLERLIKGIVPGLGSRMFCMNMLSEGDYEKMVSEEHVVTEVKKADKQGSKEGFDVKEIKAMIKNLVNNDTLQKAAQSGKLCRQLLSQPGMTRGVAVCTIRRDC